ncbi:ABC transporter permease [Auraticoccus monumenti]|uniref:ABC-2 type transport system permease protein n=1 Tax=Auraticoccus monumenti TaxID=675864 RepID=A0A1G7B5G3_9ACTN|nr:polyketide antibiotic transporter [Auraticoccus monumenti]SDE22202.1 ABC-2 type transport system permease protein [Auraticoccus monumenti]
MRALVRAQLRRDRWQLVVWIGGMALLSLAAAAAISTEFGEESQRAAVVAVAAANPAFLFLRGTPDGTSVGAVTFFQLFSFLGVLAGLMQVFLVVRHTRADEEAGRAELVGATPTGRLLPLAATLATSAVAGLLLGALAALALLVAGLDATGAVLTGAALGLVGLVFAGVAAVCAQVLPTSRAANGLAGGLVGLAYLVRGVGDALGSPSADLTRADPAWLSWLSPIGWGQRVSPFGEQRPEVLLLPAATSVLLAVLALLLRRARDLGGSLVTERPGPAEGGRLTGSAAGLALRQQLPSVVGWCLGAAALGSLAGLLSPVVVGAAESNQALGELIARLQPGAGGDVLEVFTTALIGISGVLAAAAGTQTVMRLRPEEAEGRAELLLSAPLATRRWLATQLALGFVVTTGVAVVAGLGAGLGFLATGLGAGWLGTGVAAALAHVPAALVVVAVVALVLAVLPRLTVPLGWGALVLALALGQLGELLRLPGWLQDVSPFRHSSALPLETLDLPVTLAVLGVAVGLAAAAVGLVRTRDLAT